MAGKVIILRGLPGSGKTRVSAELRCADNQLRQTVVVSADHYFVVGNTYRYDPTKIGEAHASCLRKYVEGLQGKGLFNVIVDNTNVYASEIAPTSPWPTLTISIVKSFTSPATR